MTCVVYAPYCIVLCCVVLCLTLWIAFVLQLNKKRLLAYKASLVVFPRRTAKPKNGDSEEAELNMARQLKGKLMPIEKKVKTLEMVNVTEDMHAFKAYHKLRTERMNVWQVGPRIKKAAQQLKDDAEKEKLEKL